MLRSRSDCAPDHAGPGALFHDHDGILHPDAEDFPAKAIEDGGSEFGWLGAPSPTELSWKAVVSDGL
jgi:hypothetical protein